MYRTNSFRKTQEEPKNMKPRFSIQKVVSLALLIFVKGLLVGLVWLIAHAATVPNDKIPHTDPGFVRFLGAISLGEIGVGSSILLILIMLHLWQVFQGKQDLL
jgi:multisubunit Na+/H+ antiporter MnhB subunit